MGSLTQGDQAPVGLQHHIPVEAPLNSAQMAPLLLGEEYNYILKGHLGLKRQGMLQVRCSSGEVMGTEAGAY